MCGARWLCGAETGAADAPAPRPAGAVLADAVRVLTEASRLTTASTRPGGGAVRADWARFVALAVAGAAANAGGVEAVLEGGPGTPEAELLRRLLVGTLGHYEEHLLEHRTEPLRITVHVEELLEGTGLALAYEDAAAELHRRRGRAPDAVVDGLLAALREQRAADWAAYGEGVARRVEALARALPGPPVALEVGVAVAGVRAPVERENPSGLEQRLLEDACGAVEVPGGGRFPLDRLEAPR